jgi:hypothetical protein
MGEAGVHDSRNTRRVSYSATANKRHLCHKNHPTLIKELRFKISKRTRQHKG